MRSVMCAYNRVNGAYACENPHLLTDILKRDWGFRGFVVSDWFANHSAVASANAGLDLEMPGGDTIFGQPSPFPEHFGAELKAAVQAGQVPESRLDDMVRRILTARIAAGQLDRTSTGSHDAVVTSEEHQNFAEQLSEQGTVLLKNDHGVLPIDDRSAGSVAVIGAAAQTNPIYTGGGSATVVPSGTVTPLDGIRARAGDGVDVTYAAGTAGTAEPPLIDTAVLTPASGAGNGLTRGVLRLARPQRHAGDHARRPDRARHRRPAGALRHLVGALDRHVHADGLRPAALLVQRLGDRARSTSTASWCWTAPTS